VDEWSDATESLLLTSSRGLKKIMTFLKNQKNRFFYLNWIFFYLNQIFYIFVQAGNTGGLPRVDDAINDKD